MQVKSRKSPKLGGLINITGNQISQIKFPILQDFYIDSANILKVAGGKPHSPTAEERKSSRVSRTREIHL